MPRECETASLSTSLRGALATKQSIPPFARLDGLLRGACHPAALCADRVARNDPEGACHRSLRHRLRMRGVQYAAASRFEHCRLWNTGSPGQAGRRRPTGTLKCKARAHCTARTRGARIEHQCPSQTSSSSSAHAGDPVFQRRRCWNREAAAYWISRMRGV